MPGAGPPCADTTAVSIVKSSQRPEGCGRDDDGDEGELTSRVAWCPAPQAPLLPVLTCLGLPLVCLKI